MAKKKKPKMFSETMNISSSLPQRLKTSLKSATLEDGRQALRRYRATGKLPAEGLNKGEAGFAEEYGGAGKLMRGGKKARKRK